MNSKRERSLTPDIPDPDALDSDTYHRVVGPALQAAAETAAKRGHKYLFDDMPAMLALVDMVTRLADLHREHSPQSARADGLLDQAASAACVMVFQEAELAPEATSQCLAALQAAYRQLHDQSVLDPGIPYVAMAWSQLEDNDRAGARHCLTQAAEQMIAAIEAWEQAPR